ncbi:MAG: YukJ family protein [Thauera phenolivorans]|uniref:YukJ family protein n=1 Tax=Thauera phenolivorans TaxID=1792543 RepID=A0A7X7R8J8_9RHOO|nr:YukJ family protein [Thauera phenolivorans]
MGLTAGYGLVIGQKHHYYRDPPDDFGRYYHGNLVVQAPNGNYHCAIDVDPKNMPNGVEWRLVRIRATDFAGIAALADGWHFLASTAASGALDYMRAPALHPPIRLLDVRHDHFLSRLLRALRIVPPRKRYKELNPPWRRFQKFLLEFIRWHPPWKSGTGIDALVDLETVIGQGVRFYVFGEPFTSGLGVHNIHQNQGDPLGSGFDLENAIWQDGATIVETADGRFIGFLNKFKTQAYETDDAGHPA